MDDIEALFSLRGASREQLRFIPDEHGGAVAGRLVVIDPDRDTGRNRTHRLHALRVGRLFDSIQRRTPLLRDRCEVRPRHRDGRRLPAPAEPQVLADVELHPGLAGRRSDPRDAPLHPQALGRVQDPRLRLRRLRPLRHLEHLPDAQGRLGQRGAPFTVLLRAPGPLPRSDASGHHRLRASDPSTARRRHQARQGRPEERPLLQDPTSRGRRRSSNCSRWACAPSNRRWRSGGSTT